MQNADDAIRAAEMLVAQIRPQLAGRPQHVQGAALVQLLAIFIAGHHPDLRTEMMALHVASATRLVPVFDAELAENRRRPKDWPELKKPK